MKEVINAVDITDTAPRLETANAANVTMNFNTKLHWAIKLRKLLLIPGSWTWNMWVRDITAKLERYKP